MRGIVLCLVVSLSNSSYGADRLNILNYATSGTQVDRTGHVDASEALAAVITAANAITATGAPACVYVPAGVYRIRNKPPQFVRAGCIEGDGSTQSVISLDADFTGDLFTWSEAWVGTTAGPRVVGLRVKGDKAAKFFQNAFVFYDRIDNLYLADLTVEDVHGRVLYSGITRYSSQAFMRESHFQSLRFFNDGAKDLPVVEFNSKGSGLTDATNEIRMSQVDIFGADGPSLVIRNDGGGFIRNISAEALRIEGAPHRNADGDLLSIGSQSATGAINNLTFDELELIDPYIGFAAMRVTAPASAPVPYQVIVRGFIDGGASRGVGLSLESLRFSTFQMSAIHTIGTNLIIGHRTNNIHIDSLGQYPCWSVKNDSDSQNTIIIDSAVLCH